MVFEDITKEKKDTVSVMSATVIYVSPEKFWPVKQSSFVKLVGH